MALNNDLNDVLLNIADNRSPVIKLSNGLYSLISKQSIAPDTNLGTNLIGNIHENCATGDEITYYFKLLGTWNSNEYFYDQGTGWHIIYK